MSKKNEMKDMMKNFYFLIIFFLRKKSNSSENYEFTKKDKTIRKTKRILKKIKNYKKEKI